jgi:hypothetical protein
MTAAALTPDDVRDIRQFVAPLRTTAEPFDILVHGITPADDHAAAAAAVAEFAAAGATWWTERINPLRGSFAEQRRRIQAGPPR